MKTGNLRLGLKLKRIHRVLEFNESQWLIYCAQHTQKIEAEQNSEKGRKSPVQINLQRLYGKRMENLRNRINVRLVNNEKDYLECT